VMGEIVMRRRVSFVYTGELLLAVG
jgi:hypothetical protein